jgi:hypothetical protein
MTHAVDPVPDGVVLYRGEAPGAIGLDIHGGHGQTWTTDFEHAAAYARGFHARLRKALLPSVARRLVLVDPATNDYNWQGVAELERLLDASILDIAGALHAGWQIYDIWSGEWTHLLRQAGYDSIATVGLEGPEEYVLNLSILTPLNGTSAEGEEIVNAS